MRKKSSFVTKKLLFRKSQKLNKLVLMQFVPAQVVLVHERTFNSKRQIYGFVTPIGILLH